MMHIIKNIIRNLALIGVMAGVGLMGLSLKVRNFDYKSLLIFYQDAAQENVDNDWVEYLLMELADTGEELPNKHVNYKTIRVQVGKTAVPFIHKTLFGFLSGSGFSPGKNPVFQSPKALALPQAGHIKYLHLFKLF
jgi:hypothetical protein